MCWYMHLYIDGGRNLEVITIDQIILVYEVEHL